MVMNNCCQQRCNLAAREILTILRLWRKTYGTVRFAPITLIQCAFSSGTIYILQALQASMGRRPATVAQSTALDQVQELVGILRESGLSWECALRIADTFERLVRDQRKILEGGATKKSGRRKRKATVTVKLPNAGDVSNAAATADSGSASAQTPETGVPPDVHVVQSPEELSVPGGSKTEDVKAFVPHPDADAFPYFLSHAQPHPNHSSIVDSPSTDNDQMFPAYANFLHGVSGFNFGHGHGYGHGHQGTSTEPHHARFSTATDDESSDSQYVSTDDQDHQMGNTDATTHTADDNDFSFIYNAEINMDAIMPGLGLFDPTGLGGAGGLESMNSMSFGMGMNAMGSGLGQGSNTAVNGGSNMAFAGPSAFGMQYMGYGSHHQAFAGGHGSHGVLGSGQPGLYNTYGDMDFTSDGEDRDLFDMIASLNTESQRHAHF